MNRRGLLQSAAALLAGMVAPAAASKKVHRWEVTATPNQAYGGRHDFRMRTHACGRLQFADADKPFGPCPVCEPEPNFEIVKIDGETYLQITEHGWVPYA